LQTLLDGRDFGDNDLKEALDKIEMEVRVGNHEEFVA
jgi:hypothetical protein